MYILLYVLWLLFNGRLSLEVCLLGVGIVAVLAVLLYLLFSYTPKKDFQFIRRIPLFLVYVFALLFEIIKASLNVLHIILHPEEKIRQALIAFEPGLKTGFGRYILANSITLTPGTITVNLNGDRFTVHCLDRKIMDGFEKGILLRLLRKMEAGS